MLCIMGQSDALQTLLVKEQNVIDGIRVDWNKQRFEFGRGGGDLRKERSGDLG